MLINRGLVKHFLEIQRGRDELERGDQPELVYGCFDSLGVERTEDVCEGCRNYHFCRSYLEAVQIKINPFERQEAAIAVQTGA